MFGFGDWLRESWQGAMDFIGSINLYESGCKIISTLVDGIKAKAAALVDTVCGVFATISNYTPFSDAKVGPLSDLTYSGGAIMTTLARGVVSRQGSLVDAVSGALGRANAALGSGLSLGFAGIPAPNVPDAPAGYARGEGKARAGGGKGGNTYITISNLSLPDITDAKGFVAGLQSLIAEYDGVPA